MRLAQPSARTALGDARTSASCSREVMPSFRKAEFLHDSLRPLTDAHHAYASSDDAKRRLAHQACYTRLEITEDE